MIEQIDQQAKDILRNKDLRGLNEWGLERAIIEALKSDTHWDGPDPIIRAIKEYSDWLRAGWFN